MEIQQVDIFGRAGIKVFARRPNSIPEALSKTIQKFEEKKAIVTEHTELTYGQLEEQSTIIAANLQQQYRVEKGDRVATIVGNRSEFPLILLACMKLGAIMVPINIKLAVEEIQFILGHSKPKVLLCEKEFAEKVEGVRELEQAVVPSEDNVVVMDKEGEFALLRNNQASFLKPSIQEEDGAFILYTSGTTGKPKGAVLSHINVIHSLINYQQTFQTDYQMKTLIAVPMFHVTGLVGQLLHMFFIGGTAYSMKRYQNEKYIDHVLENEINFLFNVPTIFIMMSTSEKFQKHQFNFVRKVAFGGSPIYQQTFQMLKQAFPKAELHNAYGSTETTSPATLMPVSYPDDKATSVGLAVPVADIKIMLDESQEAPLGTPGELYIKGPMVIEKYWDNDEANLTGFYDGYWKSGDLGMVDEEGFFYIRDRKKDMINRAGEKIFSIEVEDVLKSHPSVVEAAVIGEPDPVYGERVKAFVVGDNLDPVDFTSLREHCLASLAKFKVPEDFELLDELPRNASGKILKNTLKTLGGKQNA